MGRWAGLEAKAFANVFGVDGADPAVAEFWSAARDAWPAVTVDASEFMTAVRDLRLRRPDPARAADLLLAFACARGEPAALEVLEQTVIARLPAALARVDPRPEVIDEACQLARTRLLLGEGGRAPRLAEYRGDAPLWVWVKTIAVRLMVDLARSTHRERLVDAETLEARLVSSGALDLELLRERQRPLALKTLAAALLELDARERNLLRLAFVDGLSVDRMALLYGNSRATAARWAAAAREHLKDLVRTRLEHELQLDAPSLESLFAALDVSLDRSLRALFDEKPP